MISVYTTTYNRGYVLNRVFESLNHQSCLDFEWVIWDDGSSDGTESLVNTVFINKAKFPIRYIKAPKHMGYTKGFNMSTELIRGDYIIFLDSNKWLDCLAVENIYRCIEKTKDMPMIAAIGGMRANEKGIIYGGLPDFNSQEYMDVSNLDRWHYGLGADKAEVYKKEVLARYKLPEYVDEQFATESIVFDQIAADGYKIRWFPIVLCYAQDFYEDGLTKNGANSVSGHIDNYKGYIYFVKQSWVLHHGRLRNYIIDDFFQTEKQLQHSLKESAEMINQSKHSIYINWMKYKMRVSKRKIMDRYKKIAEP